MSIAAVFVITALSITLLAIALQKQDLTLLFFAGTMFIFLGLTTYINGYEELATVYSKTFGILFIFLGSYVGIRSAIEIVMKNFS